MKNESLFKRTIVGVVLAALAIVIVGVLGSFIWSLVWPDIRDDRLWQDDVKRGNGVQSTVYDRELIFKVNVELVPLPFIKVPVYFYLAWDESNDYCVVVRAPKDWDKGDGPVALKGTVRPLHKHISSTAKEFSDYDWNPTLVLPGYYVDTTTKKGLLVLFVGVAAWFGIFCLGTRLGNAQERANAFNNNHEVE